VGKKDKVALDDQMLQLSHCPFGQGIDRGRKINTIEIPLSFTGVRKGRPFGWASLGVVLKGRPLEESS